MHHPSNLMFLGPRTVKQTDTAREPSDISPLPSSWVGVGGFAFIYCASYGVCACDGNAFFLPNPCSVNMHIFLRGISLCALQIIIHSFIIQSNSSSDQMTIDQLKVREGKMLAHLTAASKEKPITGAGRVVLLLNVSPGCCWFFRLHTSSFLLYFSNLRECPPVSSSLVPCGGFANCLYHAVSSLRTLFLSDSLLPSHTPF